MVRIFNQNIKRGQLWRRLSGHFPQGSGPEHKRGDWGGRKFWKNLNLRVFCQQKGIFLLVKENLVSAIKKELPRENIRSFFYGV